ncbi:MULTISPECIES: hypothetical protein [unclassified Bradyrhizobium]|uniref:hypothetical protein n=1 Tax=unclassified Bradyrhizobium TaxID=2631580 RepID=UPI00247AB512|nr:MULTISPECIES: hypothetical protein [unclassified Bradyrhizobium]WGS19966.1 hypothetical protein MTX22_37605 [Bradyrhizobium sp. ISRA463]WGS26821.1 hypothetical protein MTX19_35045 [Bradyrhizobium sp. ISRA464]
MRHSKLGTIRAIYATFQANDDPRLTLVVHAPPDRYTAKWTGVEFHGDANGPAPGFMKCVPVNSVGMNNAARIRLYSRPGAILLRERDLASRRGDGFAHAVFQRIQIFRGAAIGYAM